MTETTQGRHSAISSLASLEKRGQQPKSRSRTMSCDVQMINSSSREPVSCAGDWDGLQRKWSLKEGLVSGNRDYEPVTRYQYNEHKEELYKTPQIVSSHVPFVNSLEELASKERISPHTTTPHLVGAQRKWAKESYSSFQRPKFGNSCVQPLLPGSLRLENFTCPICLYVFYEPITLRCSHTFCRSCISQAVYGPLNMNSCPVCRSELGLEPYEFALNSLLTSIIEDAFPLHAELSKRMHEERASDLSLDASVQKALRRRPFTGRRVRRTMRNFGNLAAVFLHPEVIIACLLVLSLSTLLLAMIAFLRGFHDVKNTAVPGTITAGIGPHIANTAQIAFPFLSKRSGGTVSSRMMQSQKWCFVSCWMERVYNSSFILMLRKFW
ncbi:hypothetical protein Gasu2_35190 [Galdieria sulphuraria]|uniref:Zinc finger (C3HC4-type RING finger) family protein n=1 Tax=Galdieria sulphuraria TaxID=130081 RepID=M2VW19_GALSU|nr:zinc finger (C3HC4-type RING finger) family protein [Galdieria sulphuraria]EME27421.1 zinc finger (C3HC4-type RING finger) family protein [Galdieria sulphuraria]GJD09258.1 hypothetical protein Gasu2_35190 [Galdieria sulphuraria]|eukprot:XP_005703941.1 zinc finger (C3HC4-type RING finger) family protein [Galdieria sulphuraria]